MSAVWIEAAAPRLTGCPLVNLQQEWLNTAREFFTRSTCWRHELQPVQIDPLVDIYALTSDIADTSINLIHRASIPTRILTPSEDRPVVRADQESETPTQYSTPEPHIMRLWPMPTEQINDMIVKVSLVPTSIDTVFPQYIELNHFEPLLDGLLGRLMSYKNKPYSDEQGAKYHLSKFRSGMARVRANTIHGLNQSENIWNFPQGFANGRY